MFVPLSVVVVFLVARYPDEGGLYVWSKRAFGPFAGFMSGWTYWTSNLPYFPALLYFTAGNALYVSGVGTGILSGSPLYFISVAILGLTVATILNIFGLGIEKWLNNIGAASRWIVTMLLIALGAVAWWKHGFATPVNHETLRPGLAIKDLLFWSTIAFAWTGPEAISFIAGEVKQPRRNIPHALLLAAPAIGVIYLCGTAAVLAILKPSETNALYGVMQSIGQAAQRFQWSFVTPVAALLVTISCLGSAGAWLGAVARLPFVAGIDRYLPRAFGHMHPRWGSPVVALVTQAVIAGVFILLGQGGTTVRGAYDVLVSMTIISSLLPFVLLFASAFRLSAGPRRPEDVRLVGGRASVVVAAALGLMTTVAAIALAFMPAADETNKALSVVKIVALTGLMVGGGVLLFAIGKRRAQDVTPRFRG